MPKGICRDHPRAFYAHTNMKSRCDNPNFPAFKWAGASGIKYHPRWSVFTAFLADMGDPPEGMVLRRKDNSKDYSPENCFWGKPEHNGRVPRRALTTDALAYIEHGIGDRDELIARLRKALKKLPR